MRSGFLRTPALRWLSQLGPPTARTPACSRRPARRRRRSPTITACAGAGTPTEVESGGEDPPGSALPCRAFPTRETRCRPRSRHTCTTAYPRRSAPAFEQASLVRGSGASASVWDKARCLIAPADARPPSGRPSHACHQLHLAPRRRPSPARRPPRESAHPPLLVVVELGVRLEIRDRRLACCRVPGDVESEPVVASKLLVPVGAELGARSRKREVDIEEHAPNDPGHGARIALARVRPVRDAA